MASQIGSASGQETQQSNMESRGIPTRRRSRRSWRSGCPPTGRYSLPVTADFVLAEKDAPQILQALDSQTSLALYSQAFSSVPCGDGDEAYRRWRCLIGPPDASQMVRLGGDDSTRALQEGRQSQGLGELGLVEEEPEPMQREGPQPVDLLQLADETTVQAQVEREQIGSREEVEHVPEEATPPPPAVEKARPKRIRAKVVRDDPPKPRRTPKSKEKSKEDPPARKQRRKRDSPPDGEVDEKRKKRKGDGQSGEVLHEKDDSSAPKRRRRAEQESQSVGRTSKRQRRGKKDVATDGAEFAKVEPIEALERMFSRLSLENGGRTLPSQTSKAMVLSTGKGIKKYRAKTVIDPETQRVWNMLMRHEAEDEDTSARWEGERIRMTKLVRHFITVMHIVQGNRRFSRWKGSVVDSCVGVFLTQNTSDNLSSSCFINLAAQFPSMPKQLEMGPQVLALEGPGEASRSQSLIMPRLEWIGETSKKSDNLIPYHVQEVEEDDSYKELELEEDDNRYQELKGELKGDDTSSERSFGVQRVISECQVEEDLQYHKIVADDSTEKGFGVRRMLFMDSKLDDSSSITTDQINNDKLEDPKVNGMGNSASGDNGEGQTKRKRKANTKKGKGKISSMTGDERAHFEAKQGSKKSSYNWEMIKDKVKNATALSSPRTEACADSIDWEAVLDADVLSVAEVIKGRGMSNMLAGRIQAFLKRIKEVHNTIDLEWLRNMDAKDAKEFLLTVHGLGLKSVECVRLLSLEQKAFPVDVNVGRICVRLGWVPIEELPDGIQFHDLDLYPVQDTVQKYLWPRLCKLDQQTLYELHYQLITCGKVFCTKSSPNCKACPLKGGCYYYHSKIGARLAIDVEHTNEVPKEWLPLEKEREPRQTDPIVEEPPDEEKETVEGNEFELPDIEDFFKPSNDDATYIDLTQKDSIGPGDEGLSPLQDLVLLQHPGTLVDLKDESSHLKTVHHAYVLMDDHPIVTRMFSPRDVDDSGHYLLVIYSGKDVASDNYFVEGTVLIPCRTAMRGSFPLNGTYFQVNEVFADHSTSIKPIDIPRSLLWNLNRCCVHFGSTVTAIFKDASTKEVQSAFWDGYVCIRAFDRTTRECRPLSKRLHLKRSPSKSKDAKK